MLAQPAAALEALIASHREAARLAAERRYAAAIDHLRAITRMHPALTVGRRGAQPVPEGVDPRPARGQDPDPGDGDAGGCAESVLIVYGKPSLV